MITGTISLNLSIEAESELILNNIKESIRKIHGVTNVEEVDCDLDDDSDIDPEEEQDKD